jgi:protein required for attachment to host cells
MEVTWVLVANGVRARCFERHATSHSLTELADFVHPQASLAGQAAGGDLTGAAAKGHGRTGHAGTQFAPQTEADDKARGEFAKQLAAYLNGGVGERRCDALVLIATSTMLGDIESRLSGTAKKALGYRVVKDFTRYEGADLKKRVNEALQLPD